MKHRIVIAATLLLVLQACEEPKATVSNQPSVAEQAPSKERTALDDKPTLPAQPPPPEVDGEEELFRWQVAVLQGESVFNPCKQSMEDLAKSQEAGDLRECFDHEILGEVRVWIMKRAGTVEERVNGALDDFAQEQLVRNERAEREWMTTRSHKMECTATTCRFMGKRAFLNDRKLVVKIMSRDKDLFAHLPVHRG